MKEVFASLVLCLETLQQRFLSSKQQRTSEQMEMVCEGGLNPGLPQK